MRKVLKQKEREEEMKQYLLPPPPSQVRGELLPSHAAWSALQNHFPCALESGGIGEYRISESFAATLFYGKEKILKHGVVTAFVNVD